jgi:hypothetical protein
LEAIATIPNSRIVGKQKVMGYFLFARYSGVNNGLRATSTYYLEARRFLSHLDDDLAFRTSIFDVDHGLFDRFEWKDSIHDWAYDSRIEERCDLV